MGERLGRTMKLKKGFAVITALMISLTLTILVGAFSISTIYRMQMYNRYINSVKAYYLAASGITYARNQLWWYGEWYLPQDTTIPITNSGDSVTLHYKTFSTTTENNARIEAVVRLKNVTRTLLCDIYAPTTACYDVYYWLYGYGTVAQKAIRWEGKLK